MKRTAVAAVLFSLVLAVAAFAAEGGQPPQIPEIPFEQKKAAILKIINARIADIQEDKDCVEAAKNEEDLKACREKTRARMEKERHGRGPTGERRGQGGQGQGGPVPGGPGQAGPRGQDSQAPPPQGR